MVSPTEFDHVLLTASHAHFPFPFLQTLDIEDSRDQEEGEDGIFNDVLIAPTKPSWVGIVSPADGNTKDQATNGGKTLVTEGILRTERDQNLGSLIEASPFPNHGRLLRRPLGPIMALPSDDEDFPVVPQSWLYGHTTLQQTGQSIGAELEVAMLCMQKRLAKVKKRLSGYTRYTVLLYVHHAPPPGSERQIRTC